MFYTVNYGVDDSHIDETRIFQLYRDAVDFYNSIDTEKYPAGLVYKLVYNRKGCVIERVAKQYRFTCSGITEALLQKYIMNQSTEL